MENNDRAKQFMPFSPLKGYSDIIKAVEKTVVQKKDLAEDSLEELSYKYSQIKVGMIVKIVHYEDGQYIATTGMVSKIDEFDKTITIVKKKIKLLNVVEISGDEICELLNE